MDGLGGLGPGRARAVGHLTSGRLGIARCLSLKHTSRLLHRRVVRDLAGQSPHLLIALSACPGTYDEADPQAGKEHDAVPHLAPLSQLRSPNGSAQLTSPSGGNLFAATSSSAASGLRLGS